MRLKISNFAKIRFGDIKVDGITVIAGENNTGKSTVGKILYCFYNAFNNLEDQIIQNREEEVFRICRNYTVNPRKRAVKGVYFTYIGDVRNLAHKVCSLEPEDFSVEVLTEIIDETFNTNDYDGEVISKQRIEELYERLKKSITIDHNRLKQELVFQFFDTNFASQIQTLKAVDETTSVSLEIKNHSIDISFRNSDTIDIEDDIDIIHEAYFIDDPFIIDSLQLPVVRGLGDERWPKEFLLNKLRMSKESANLFDAISAKDNIKEILALVNGIVPGKISSQSGRWTLSSEHYDRPVDFNNLSAGLKSFVILKMLLEKAILKEKDVLILDEPEIHLHPEWQIKYAEIVVLLQTKFDLNIIVTTHSRDFFEAIELYSKKHGISKKCNYYLARMEDGTSSFEDVTEDTTSVFRQLIRPSALLDQLRFSLEEDENE